MPDLHGWITQQIDDREQLAELISPGGFAPDEWRIEPSRSGRWVEIVAYSRTNIEPPEAASREQAVALTQTDRNEHLLIAMHDPAAVLRRCAADRKILAEHKPQPDGTGFPDSLQCGTCSRDGGDGYQYLVPYPCPTVMALAEAYGWEADAPQSEEDDPPVQCWHTEPDTPCDWNICRQPERLAAGDRGVAPARNSSSEEQS